MDDLLSLQTSALALGTAICPALPEILGNTSSRPVPDGPIRLVLHVITAHIGVRDTSPHSPISPEDSQIRPDQKVFPKILVFASFAQDNGALYISNDFHGRRHIDWVSADHMSLYVTWAI